jgi:hypothetical protein
LGGEVVDAQRLRAGEGGGQAVDREGDFPALEGDETEVGGQAREAFGVGEALGQFQALFKVVFGSVVIPFGEGDFSEGGEKEGEERKEAAAFGEV